MKRIYTLIAAALLLVGCAEQEQTATIRFDLAGFESGEITKTTTAAIGAAITATATTTPPTLTLTSTTNPERVYTVVAGQEVSVALDRYNVTADHRPEAIGNCYIGGVYTTPTYTINQQVNVAGETERYTLNAQLSCFALVLDHSVVATYGVQYNGDYRTIDTYTATEGIEVRYVLPDNAAFPTRTTRLQITPADQGTHEARSWSVRWGGSTATADCTFETGYWYCFSPAALTLTSGTFNVSLPTFREGWLDD